MLLIPISKPESMELRSTNLSRLSKNVSELWIWEAGIFLLEEAN